MVGTSRLVVPQVPTHESPPGVLSRSEQSRFLLPKLCPIAPNTTLQDRTERHAVNIVSVCICKELGELENEWVGLKIRRCLATQSAAWHQLSVGV